MVKVVTLILAGGQGARLYPLTQLRSKPAVPIAGKFRLIDIAISNCIHSGLRRIFILTQYSSVSLHRHIFNTYSFDNFSKDFVTILSAMQTPESDKWYQGTADSVRQNLRFIRPENDLVLILSGDHLYRMDYCKFIDFHLQKKADVTISVYPVSEDQVSEFGVMKVNNNGIIVDFCEKPKTPEQKRKMQVSENIFNKFGLEPGGRTHLASMGVYVFNRNVLCELLQNTTYEDFGKEVIPYAIGKNKVYGYFFNSFWADIGTIRNFFDTHMDLTQPLPKFNFYDEQKPIYTHARFLPGSKILDSKVHRSILSEGSIINRANINHSIIGVRSRIDDNSTIDHSIIMGADFFESQESIVQNTEMGLPKIGIGDDCEIRNAIIDKNARIGSNVKLINNRGIQEEQTENYAIRDGIIVVPKGAIIPDRTVI